MLVNVELPALDGSPRLRMENNFWIETGTSLDLECPPSGTTIRARYDNGDAIDVRFREIASKEAFVARYPSDQAVDAALAKAGADVRMIDIALEGVSFPVAVVEIELKLLGGEIDLNSRYAEIRNVERTGAWVADSPLGLVVRTREDHPWHGIGDFERSLYDR